MHMSGDASQKPQHGDETHAAGEDDRLVHTASALEPEMVTPLPNSSSVTSVNATAFFATA